MGKHARRIQDRLADGLAAAMFDAEWTVERSVGGTPVDVVGETEERLVLVELEWRRADPADNAAKLFRHLAAASDALGTRDDHEAGTAHELGGAREAVVVQVFTRYYELANGGVSSKRENATFVGDAAADYLDRVTYREVDLAIEPPKRGGDLPEEWAGAVEAVVASIETAIDSE